MHAAIPCHPNGSLQRCPTYFNYAQCSRHHCRSLSVQDATQSTRVASKWADITVAMTRFLGYILCRDCCGHYKKEECWSPTLDGQWRCSWCTGEFRGTQRKLATVDWSTLRDGWEFVWRNMLRFRAFLSWRQQVICGPQPCYPIIVNPDCCSNSRYIWHADHAEYIEQLAKIAVRWIGCCLRSTLRKRAALSCSIGSRATRPAKWLRK